MDKAIAYNSLDIIFEATRTLHTYMFLALVVRYEAYA